MVFYLLYVFNIRLPKLPKISIEESPKPREKKSETKTERATITITRPDVSTEEIREKISKATGNAIDAWKKSGSLIKDLIKKQVDEKVEAGKKAVEDAANKAVEDGKAAAADAVNKAADKLLKK